MTALRYLAAAWVCICGGFTTGFATAAAFDGRWMMAVAIWTAGATSFAAAWFIVEDT